MKAEIKFENSNDWTICRIGKAELVPGGIDTRLSHMTTPRGKHLTTREADAWLEARTEYLDELNKWCAARERAIGEWKHATPHRRYNCDRGSLALSVNGARVLVRNHVGDGSYPVYAICSSDRPWEDLPPFFRPADLCVDGPCKVEVLDGDCGAANTIWTIDVADGDSLSVYRDDHGAMAVNYGRNSTICAGVGATVEEVA